MVTELHSQDHEETSNMPTCRSGPKTSNNYVSSIERKKTGIEQVGRDGRKIAIYTISYSSKETQSSEFDTQRLTSISEAKACSSRALSKPSGKQNKQRRLQLNVPHSDDSDDNSSTPQKSRYLDLAENILFEMMINIEKEEAYIYYLQQLLVLENTATLDDFKILEFNDPLAPKHLKIKTTKQNARQTGNHDKVKKSNNKKPQMVEFNVQFLGRHLDRLELRKSLLENVHDHCKDDKTYKLFFNKIFDFEESIIMEQCKSVLE
jgi:hypothetical protein